MSVSVASAYTHQSPTMDSTAAEFQSTGEAFPRTVLMHFEESVAETAMESVITGSCLRGLCNALLIELATLAIFAGGWYLFRIF